MTVSNKQISKLFRLGAQLLELHDDNPFKSKAYDTASLRIRSLPQSLAEVPEDELENIDGIGKNLAKKIMQIRETGTYEELDRLVALTPPGVLEMAAIRGLGVKKVRTLWEELGITSPEALLKACEEDKVQALRGFGKKTQENIIELIEFYFESKHKYLYAEAEVEVDLILHYLERDEDIARVSLTGDMRRKAQVVTQVEFLVQLKKGKKLDDILDERAEEILSRTEKGFATAHLEIPLIFHEAKEKDWVQRLFETTGAEAHLDKLDRKTFSASSEEDIYVANQRPYIIPEMREGRDEFETMESLPADEIVRFEDIKGCLHNHSQYSDGVGTIEEMARACMEHGYTYFGLCDHSKSASYANGLQPKRLFAQWKEIDKLNKSLSPFRIFKGIESDILRDGGLDYDESILKQFDFVVASVHSQLKMNEQEATHRLIAAIENPYTTILGHMTARLLLMRKGFPVNHKKVIDACASNGVFIELNANPRRLDMDWTWINYAVRKDVMIAINPDAHDTSEIPNMYYGVCVGRKAGLPRDMVLNCLTLPQIEDFFNRKKAARP